MNAKLPRTLDEAQKVKLCFLKNAKRALLKRQVLKVQLVFAHSFLSQRHIT